MLKIRISPRCVRIPRHDLVWEVEEGFPEDIIWIDIEGWMHINCGGRMRSVEGKVDCEIKALSQKKQDLFKEINTRLVQLEHKNT